jgi:NAD(P)-dependent dehydrogenase (short-subunit alcohol dehydrogenase family)
MRTANISKWAIGLGAVGAAALALRAVSGLRYSLAGKVVLVTGGSRGLGLELARAFAAQGAKLVLIARDTEELGRARTELKDLGAGVLALACDVTDPAAVRRAVSQALDWYDRIDVLVNNAGTIEVGPMETMRREDYETAMQTHFWGPLSFTLEVVPHMRARGEGRIVNVASIGGVVAMPHLLPYSASKFALTGLSEGLHAELAKDGIRVTTVCPGLMRTGSARNAWFKGDVRAEYAWFSVSAGLPLTSMSSARAARRIVTACRRGEAHVVVSLQAKLVAIAHGLFPGVTADILALVNRLLPAPSRVTAKPVRGSDTGAPIAPELLTALNDRAAARNNEMHARR